MTESPNPIADYACHVGEGPLWRPEDESLYWTDIETGRLFRYTPATGTHEPVYQGLKVGGMTLQADGSLLLFRERGNIAIWKDGKETVVIDSIADELDTRFNDVIAAPHGGVFCGTMPTKERPGRLYHLATSGELSLLLEGIGCSNGMGFTPDREGMYYTDTTAHNIYRFDYDSTSGQITNQCVFLTTEGPGAPDGMTVDADGYLWVAFWGGSYVRRYSPEGTEVDRIELPTPKVTCPLFAGPDYTDLYITTAGGGNKATDGELAGALFRLQIVGVKGVPEFRSQVEL